MIGTRSRNWRSDSLTRLAIGVSGALAVLTLIGLFIFGRGTPLPPLAWFLTTSQAFVTLSAFALSALCFGRFRTLGGSETFWSGLAFLANGILGAFFLLAWPGLLGERGLISQAPNTAGWLFLLTYSSPALLAAGAHARRPTHLAISQLIVAYVATAILSFMLGLLSVLIEGALPGVVVGNTFTLFALIWQSLEVLVLAAGAVRLVRQYLAEGDRFLVYLAMFLVVVAFALLGNVIGEERYDIWWYASRLIVIPAYLMVLFGLLQEGYGLYRAERLRTEHLAALNEVSRVLATATELEGAGHVVLAVVARALGVSATALYVRQEGGDSASLLASIGLSPDFVDRFGVVPLDEDSFVRQAMATGRPWITDAAQLPPVAGEALRAAGVTRFAAVAVRARRKVVGVLAVGRNSAERLTDQEVELISSIADQIGVAVENARLYEAIRNVNERLAVTSIRAQDLAEEAQRRAEEMNALIESMAEGVTIADGEGRIVRVNRAGKEIWGLSDSEDVVGTPAGVRGFDLRHLDNRPLPKNDWPMTRALRGETFSQQEVLYVTLDGRRYNLLFAGSAVRDDEGRIILAINVYRDITPIRDLERQREEFISVVAHDLRGAMTSVKGYADLLMRPATRESLPANVQRALEGISTGSRRLNRMIADLLDVSRIEARRLTLIKQPVDLVSLVREVIQRSTELTKGHAVRLEAREDIPELEADPDRIEQILSNLLSNAAKYAYPETEVTVEIERRPGEALVSVTNLGKGILPEEREMLFTRFHRTRQAQAENVPGLGLGLYIARGLVEAHGGRIWVESKPEEYATFRFTLPA